MGSDRRGQLAEQGSDRPVVGPAGPTPRRTNARRIRPVDPLRDWLKTFPVGLEGLPHPPSPAGLVDAVVAAGAAELGCVIDGLEEVPAAHMLIIDRCRRPPGGWSNPWLAGLIHERVVSIAARQKRGAWYTPRPLVEGLLRFIDTTVDVPPFAVDPTCGGGAFLLAVLDRWVDGGVEPSHALGRVAGIDIDAGAVHACRRALQLWAAGHDLSVPADDLDVAVGDALILDAPSHWPHRRLVIGNPPFATPLKRGAIPETAQRYRQANADELGHYADLAALHLHRCVEQAGRGSVVSLVLPQSVLSSRDVESFRARLADRAATAGMWAAREAVFEAGVRTCAPVLVVGGRERSAIRLASGGGVDSAGTSEPAWLAAYAARCLGGPTLPASVVRPVGTLDDICTATAGFRDEYYGLVAACREWDDAGEPPNRLITVGSVDPLTTTWGRSAIRFGRRRWTAPVVDVGALNDKVGRWWSRQARPKVVVATQSKILEPVIDADGRLVPSTPLLVVHAEPDDLAEVAAVLLAPPVVALAWERWFGSALAVDALKLAARQLGGLPLPPDRPLWRSAADLIRSSAGPHMLLSPEDAPEVAAEVAAIMNAAYGADDSVLRWWRGRAGRQTTARR